MFVAVIIIHVICSLALILIVLLQAGKGVGIANVFGGAGQTVFGARTGDVLARGTEVCAGLFMLTSLGLAIMSSDRSGSVMRKVRPVPVEQSAPASPVQQEAMAKVKEVLAGMAESMKQAPATQAASQKPVVQETAPAPAVPEPAAAVPEPASATPAEPQPAN